MNPFAAITRLLGPALLALFVATSVSDATMIMQVGARHHVQPGGGGGGEWADTYISNISGFGAALTDGTTVGIEVGSDFTGLGQSLTSGNGATMEIVTGGSFDGLENAVKIFPPTACVPEPCNEDNNAQYAAWLSNLNVWNSATHDVAQMNFRVLVYYGPRYFDLAPDAKSWGFQAQTVLSMSGGDGNNRSGTFDNRDTGWSNWKYPYPTVTTVSIYCNPVSGSFIDECPNANKIIEIRGSANHSASPPQTGGEWICFEHVFDTRQNRGNANGLVRLLVWTRDGLVSARYVEAPLTHDGGWDFAAQYIYQFEGAGFYFNQAGTANADNYVMFSHATFAANMANTDTLIGPPPGFLLNFFFPVFIAGRMRPFVKRMRKWLVALVGSLLVTSYAIAAVTNLGTPTSEQGNSATASIAHTVASGTGVVSYIAVFVNNDVGITSMNTFGGVAPVLVGSYATALYVYRVVSPAAGATNATANLPSGQLWSIHVITLQGVDTADPDDTIVTDTNSELAALSAVVSSATNELVLAFGEMILSDIAAASGATLSTEEESIDGSQISTALVYEAGAASVTLGVSSSGNSFGDNRILGFAVNAAAGGASGLLLRRRRN